MSTFPSKASYFQINANALIFELNALGSPDNVSVSVFSNTRLIAYVPGVPDLEFPNGDAYRTWTITAFATHFTDTDGVARYAHVAASRTTGNATIVFPDTRLDLYGRAITDDGTAFIPTPDPSSPSPSDAASPSQFGSEALGTSASSDESSDPSTDGEFYFFFLGKLSASESGTKQRQWTDKTYPIYGTLDTARYHEEEQKGEWAKMFSLDQLYEYIIQHKPIWESSIRTLVLNGKRVLGIKTTDPNEDVPVSDEILPSYRYTDQEYLSKKKTERQAVVSHVTFERAISVEKGTTLNGGVDIAADTTGTAANFGLSLVRGASGAGVWRDDNGAWHMQADYLYVANAIEANEVEIQRERHIAGASISTAAGAVITSVSNDDFYHEWESSIDNIYYPALKCVRCFFLAQDGDNAITNDWKVGDQARVQAFNLSGDDNALSRFWWRLVLGVGTTDDGTLHYIDVYVGDYIPSLCAAQSQLPKAGDNVILLGSQGADMSRRHASVTAGAGEGAPYLRQYYNIFGFTMPEPRIDLNPVDSKLSVSRLSILASNPDGTQSETDITDRLNDLDGFEIFQLDIAAPRDANGDYFSPVPAATPGFPPLSPTDGQPSLSPETALHSGGNFATAPSLSDGQPAPSPGDYAITTDGVCYQLTAQPDDTLAWTLVTDAYLLQALTAATAANDSLRRMASDNIITAQEKQQLQRDWQQMQQQYTSLTTRYDTYASQLTLSLNYDTLKRYYDALATLMQQLLADMGSDTKLAEDDGTLLVYVEMSMNALWGDKQKVSFPELWQLYVKQCRLVEVELNAMLRNFVNTTAKTESAAAANLAIQQQVKGYLDDIWTALDMQGNIPGSYSQVLRDHTAILTAAYEYNSETGEVSAKKISGLVTTADFASLVSQVEENGKVISAMASTYVRHDENGWISGFSIKAKELIIDTDNFKIDEKGNVAISGSVSVSSMRTLFADLTRVYYVKTKDIYGNEVLEDLWGSITLDMIQSAPDDDCIFDAEQTPIDARGIYNYTATGVDITLSSDERYIGQRVVLFNGTTYPTEGGSEIRGTRVSLDQAYDKVVRYFLGGGQFANPQFEAEHPGMEKPSNLVVYSKIYEIEFWCGVMEFLGVPGVEPVTGRRYCKWCIVNDSVTFRRYTVEGNAGFVKISNFS